MASSPQQFSISVSAAPAGRQGIFAASDYESSAIQANGSLIDGAWVRCMEDTTYQDRFDWTTGGSGGFGPSTDFDVRVVHTKAWNGRLISPRTGSYFLATTIYKDKDYSDLNGAPGANDPVLDKPRLFALVGSHANHRFDWDEEVWIGWSIFLPHDLEFDLGVRDHRSGNWLQSVFGSTYEASASMFNLGYFCPPGIDEAHWWIQGGTDAQSPLEGQPTGSYDYWDLGSAAGDRGLWTDWVYRLRFNPFSTPTTLYGKTYQANRGIMELWKSTGPVLNSRGDRAMAKVHSRLNVPIGLRPGDATDSIQFSAPRQYKYGWKKPANGSTVTGPIFIGFDAVRMGRAADGAGFSDVHPTQLTKP